MRPWLPCQFPLTRAALALASRYIAMYADPQWQRTACPLPSQRSARADVGNEDKGPRLAGILPVMTFTMAG